MDTYFSVRHGRSFFTQEMSARLREFRKRAHLTLEEVARRMGIRHKSGKTTVSLLERGKVPDPRMSTIALYLRACGTKAFEFWDLLTKVDLMPLDTSLIERTSFPADHKERLKTETVKQVERYQDRTEFPVAVKVEPVAPAKVSKAVQGFREYRLQVNIIEAAVKEMFEQEYREAQQRGEQPAVRYYDYCKYYTLARRILSVLRKFQEPKLGRKLAESMSFAVAQELDATAADRVQALVQEVYRKLRTRADATKLE